MLLKEKLFQKGWIVSAGPECETLFSIYTDKIYWRVTRGAGPQYIDLEFWINGVMGERSTRLTDIFYCELVSTGQKLHFGKLGSKKWRLEVDEFVDVINRTPKTNAADYQTDA